MCMECIGVETSYTYLQYYRCLSALETMALRLNYEELRPDWKICHSPFGKLQGLVNLEVSIKQDEPALTVKNLAMTVVLGHGEELFVSHHTWLTVLRWKNLKNS